MGEAKRRRDAREEAYAYGKLFKPEPECPGCQSKRIKRIPAPHAEPLMQRHFGVDLEMCMNCEAIWEAFPAAGYVEDSVCAEPCDNCAFRPGSPEQADKEGWKALIAKLKPGADDFFKDRFYCHKGVPIDLEAGPGNFKFPQRAVTMDGEIVRNPDGSPALIADTAKMRTCSGFLRMFWAQRAKLETVAD